jgi:cation transport ATPase
MRAPALCHDIKVHFCRHAHPDTDVAMNSTPVKGDLRGIASTRALSQATIANMKQNLSFAFIYNALGVLLAAGLLYPFTAGCCRR